MFERFTDRARKVAVLAKDEAAALGHRDIYCEHILLGLLKEGEGVGFIALDALGVKYGETQRFMEKDPFWARYRRRLKTR